MSIDVKSIMSYVEGHIENLGQRLQIDGRQVRSACESAVALAAYQKDKSVNHRHIMEVLEASQEFESYLSNVNDIRDYEARTRARDAGGILWDETKMR